MSREESPVTSLPVKTTKRSFDVAFLISQDDKVKQKRKVVLSEYQSDSSNDEPRFVPTSPQVFDDPRNEQKSAFTKVKLDSPELNYSLSPSPPAYQKIYLPPSTTVFKNIPQYPIDQNLFSPKVRHYRPEFPHYVYPNFAQPDLVKFHPPPPQELVKLQQNPAAAILNSLLPPSFAALSLPAQNVCAKCNISFRMTSDLVYHMRSHHKSEMANDSFKKRREDKLKCPVCSESFRERHHLTRHMTAHQDKEGDGIEDVCSMPSSSTRKVRTTDLYSNNLFCK